MTFHGIHPLTGHKQSAETIAKRTQSLKNAWERRKRNNPQPANVLGMDLERWKWKSCVALFATDYVNKWATLYSIESADEGKGHATELLTEAKNYYIERGLRVGGTVALHPAMRHIYKKLNIKEYA